MEIEFGKHFKDATNSISRMDYDSGYVEAGESSSCTSSNTESVSSTKMSAKVSQNFFFNEDALLEKPEIALNWNTNNLPYEIDLEEYAESRQLFFSPGFINASVQSDNSSLAYSGLESQSSSNESIDLPLEKPIFVKNKSDIREDEIIDDDVLIISASEIDMSLEESENESDMLQSHNLITGNTGESAIKCTNEDLSPQNTEDDLSSIESDIKTDDSFMETESNSSNQLDGSFSVKSTGIWNVKNLPKKLSPSKSNPTNVSEVPKVKRRLTLVFCKSDKENVYSVKRKYPSLTPTKKTPEKSPSREQPYPCLTPEKNDSFKHNLSPEKASSNGTLHKKTDYMYSSMYSNMTPEKKILEVADSYDFSKENLHRMTPEEASCSSVTFNKTDSASKPCMNPEKKIPNPSDSYIIPKENLRNKYPRATPEKSLQKLAINNNNSLKKFNSNFVEESKTPEKQPLKPVNAYFSPDLFDENDIVDESTLSYSQLPPQQKLTQKSQTNEEKLATKLDQKLLKRTQKGMSGVLPPPSVTIVHLSAADILSKWQENKSFCFWNKSEKTDLENQDKSLNSSNTSITNNSYSKSLLLTADVEEAKYAKWPQIYDMRCHGLHYNCGKVSEEIVDLCDKYQKRFVGAETQSTCTIFEKQNSSSPSNRKTTKPRFGGKSPGRRLSHLALRRKITFSHASQASSSSLVGSRARQILVDAKKIDLLSRRKSPRKTPKKTPRKTPSKSPRVKTRTPSSSAKKKLAMRFRKLTGELQKSVPDSSEMSATQKALFNSPIRGASQSVNRSTKRALFQSPGSNNSNSSSIFSNKSLDLCGSQEKRQFRRALFASPKKHSPLKMKKSPFKQFGMERKRKRSESDDLPGAKVARSASVDHRPSTSTDLNKSLSRTQSECNTSLNRSQSHSELSEQHKRKLIWAVSGALESQNVSSVHPQWKLFASVLARVTRRFYIDQIQTKNGKLECSTSDRMHRIARHHVISVIKGKTADEIINDYVAKNRALRVQKPQGYIAPEEFNRSKTVPSGGKENAFQDRSNTIESWEKRKIEQISKPSENRIDRIRKVINFGDDR